MQWVYELNRGYKWPVAQWPSMWAVISLKFNQFLFKFIIEPRLMKVEVTMILRYMCDAHASVASSVGCQVSREGCKSSSLSIVSKSIKYRFYNAIKMCRIIDKSTLCLHPSLTATSDAGRNLISQNGTDLNISIYHSIPHARSTLIKFKDVDRLSDLFSWT